MIVTWSIDYSMVVTWSNPLIISQEGSLTMAEYVEWAKQDDLSLELMNVMFEVCHIRFGLRPQDKKDEARVVG